MARSHALVVGFARDQMRRHLMIPPAEIRGGRCIGCGTDVYVNPSGAAAIRQRDADVVCERCESMYHADINRSLIES